MLSVSKVCHWCSGSAISALFVVRVHSSQTDLNPLCPNNKSIRPCAPLGLLTRTEGDLSPVYTSTLNRFQIGLGQLCKHL